MAGLYRNLAKPVVKRCCENCRRVYAVYGGMFIILSLLWGWKIDGKPPDTFDWIGAVICLIGVTVALREVR